MRDSRSAKWPTARCPKSLGRLLAGAFSCFTKSMQTQTARPPEGEIVLKLALERDDEHYVYFVDRRGDVVRMARGQGKEVELVHKTPLSPKLGETYFLDGSAVRKIAARTKSRSRPTTGAPAAAPERELVKRTGLDKDDARFLYFLDRRGNVCAMERGQHKAPLKVLMRSGVRR